MLALDELGLVQPPISCRVLFYCGYIGIMEKKMETTMMGYIYIYWGNIRVLLGLYRDNGEENGNYTKGI